MSIKAVVYHADARLAWGESDVGDLYQRLFVGFLRNCHAFNLPVVHLTLDGFPGWGDENIFYKGFDAAHVVHNRQILFAEYLATCSPDEVVWFGEPDYRIFRVWPPLTTDCALLYREGDDVALCPAWSLAKRSALPIFRQLADGVDQDKKDWHGDSSSFIEFWGKLGRPRRSGTVVHDGISIELRPFEKYIKGNKVVFGRNYMASAKYELLNNEPKTRGKFQ